MTAFRFGWLCAAAFALLSPATAPAQTVWNNSFNDSSWSTAANWSLGIPSAGTIAEFTDTGAGPITLDGLQSALGLTFTNTMSYTFNSGTGGPFTLSIFGNGIASSGTGAVTINPQIILGAAQTWAFTNASSSLTTGAVELNGFGLTVGATNAAPITLGGIISGTGTLTASGGTVSLGAANSYAGTTTVLGGTLRTLVTGALPAATTLAFPIATTGSTVTVDLQGTAQTITNMTFVNTATATVNFTGTATSALTVTGTPLTIAPVNAAATSSLTVSMATLGSFTYNNPTGTFTANNGASVTGGNAVNITLSAATNTITAATLNIGNGSTPGGVVNTFINLGTTNVLNVNTLRLGNARPGGHLRFATGLTNPTLTIAGATGGLTNLNLGILRDSNAAAALTDSLDTTLGTLTAAFNNVVIGQNRAGTGNRTTNVTSSFLMAAGSITASTMSIGIIDNRTTPTPASTMNTQTNGVFTLTGGTASIGTLTIATMNYTDTFAGTASTLNGTVTLNAGATLNATTIQRGATATPTAGSITINSRINWNDGTIGNIDGAGLDISGTNVILAGAAANHTFNISSGQTGTVNSILSGTGSITKAGPGLLTLAGANTYTGATTVNGGTLQIAGSGTLGAVGQALAVNGGGTFDLNGLNQTVGELAGTGTVLNNLAATTSVLTAGSGNVGSTFAGILANGNGTLSLTKTGTGTLTLGGTNTYTGNTTVEAGTLNVAGSLAAGGGLTVNAGGTLNFTSGTGNNLNALTSLSLGVGTGNTFLGFQLATPSTSDRLQTAAAAATGSAANNLSFNFTALPGFGPGLYPLLSAASGLTSGGMNYALGTVPPGFAYDLITSDTAINLNVFTIVPTTGPIFWTGLTNGKWNQTITGNAVNFATTIAGTTVMTGSPNSANTVNFSATNATSAITTLETSFTINDLVFNNQTGAGAVASIGPGLVATSTLSINPAAFTDGIRVQTGAPATITISAPLNLGNFNQTWTIADGPTSLTVSGGITGTANVAVAGLGALFINDLGTAYTGNVTANNAAVSFGGTVNSTVSGVIAGTAAILKADTNTVTFTNAANTYTGSTNLNGGTLSVPGVANGGLPSGIGASTSAATNLTFNGGSLVITALTSATDRAMTFIGSGGIALTTDNATLALNGALTGAGTLTFGLNTTLVSSLSSYSLTANNTGFTGGVTVNNGALTITNANNLGSGPKTITVRVNTTGIASLRLDGTGGNIALPADFSFVTSVGGNAASGIFNVAGNNTIAGNFTLVDGNGGTLVTVPAGTLILSGGITAGNPGSVLLLGAGTGTLTGVIADGSGTVGLTKTADAGTWTVTNSANTYTFGTTVIGGSLISGADNAFGAGGLTIGDTSSSVGTLDLAIFNQTSTFFNVQTNSASFNTLLIGAGKTLTLTGNVAIGSPQTASTTTNLNATGGGSLVVNNPATNGLFAVGGVTSGAGNGSLTNANFSGLNSLTVNLDPTNGIFRVNPVSSTNVAGHFSTLTLPATTTITANRLNVGDSSQGNVGTQINTLRLGAGTNAINVDTVNIATGGRDLGQIIFNTTTGSLQLRNAAGTGRAALNVSTGTANTGVIGSGSLDLRGHNADLMLSTVNIGTQPRSNTLTANVWFDQGIFDAETLTAATTTQTSESGNGGGLARINNAALNIGGGTVTITNGIANLGRVAGTAYTDAAKPHTMNGTLNVTGGTVTIGAPAGTAATLATIDVTGAANVAALAANGTINVTGGSVTFQGNIVTGGISATSMSTGTLSTAATVIVDGGSVNMSGFSIGTAALPVTLSAASGTLSNLGQLNDGGTFTKTTAGTLTLAGTNNYTGTTQISAGTLAVNGNNTLATGAVTTDLGSVLRGTGTVGGPVTVNGTIRGGNSIGTLTLASTLNVNAGATIYVEIASGLVNAAPDTGGSTQGTLPNPTSNNFLNIAGTTVLDPGTLITVDGTAATFNGGAYSYRIGTGPGLAAGPIVTVPGQFTFVGFAVAPTEFSLNAGTGGEIYLNFTTVVPEPMALIPLAALLLVRRRR